MKLRWILDVWSMEPVDGTILMCRSRFEDEPVGEYLKLKLAELTHTLRTQYKGPIRHKLWRDNEGDDK